MGNPPWTPYMNGTNKQKYGAYNRKQKAQVDVRLAEELRLWREDPSITVTEMAVMMKRTIKTIYDDLVKLQDMGVERHHCPLCSQEIPPRGMTVPEMRVAAKTVRKVLAQRKRQARNRKQRYGGDLRSGKS